jgi:predicted heme/steroid binding protein
LITKAGATYSIGTKVQVMVEQPKFYYKVVPLQLDKITFSEVDTIAITAGAATSGNITINLDGKDFTVAVTAGDSTTAVATKIRNATYTGWTTSGSGTSIIFTSTTPGERITATFNGGTTGATATVTKTQTGKEGKGFHLRKARYYVSDTKKAGFKLHPAFIHNGKEKNFIYLSAYEGTIYDVSASAYILDDAGVGDFTATTGDKLCSIANAKPASGLSQALTRAAARTLANNRGGGWQQTYAATVSATQLLFLIEYASLNTQSTIGFGVSKTDDGTTNMADPTGATTLLGNASGVTNTSITYRGEENFWMNLWKWVDGINIYTNGENFLYVADNSFADNVSTAPYKDVGFAPARLSGYVSAFGYSEDFDWLFIASETAGDAALPVGDYFYQNHVTNSWYVPTFGGNFTHVTPVGGGYCWSISSASTSRGRSNGCRLVYIPDTF